MDNQNKHYTDIASLYDRLAENGPYATLAPHNRGGRKGEYVAAVFDTAITHAMQGRTPCESLLDFGCGTGTFIRRASAISQQVVGVDVSAQILAVAAQCCRDLPNVTLLQIDGEHLALPDHAFSCVVAREVLCYVADERLPMVLAEINRVLKPGGYFYWLEQVSDNPFWQRRPGEPLQVKRSPASLRHFAEQVGLTIISESVARTPRFPWIYPIWFGLVPRAWIPQLAKWESAWHLRFGLRGRRWWNTLLVLRKVS
jgi:SAM-dependent methyltransferase